LNFAAFHLFEHEWQINGQRNHQGYNNPNEGSNTVFIRFDIGVNNIKPIRTIDPNIAVAAA